MKVTVCIGSSCHLKGSRQVVEQLKELIASKQLQDQVDLSGTFCMGNCEHGVSASLDGENHSLTPDNTRDFFERQILAKLAVND
ncbi:MAG: (2Fe-2S) ferredoxin domain-containing protein [Clostridiaceae bacterium]|nr:(2Fe-2S) ferredoxin domain-containing protein [Clostridiaceae bacterium]